MKHICKSILAAILAAMMLLALTSCSLLSPKPETDFSDAKKALEAAGYTVSVSETNSGDIDQKGIVKVLYAYSDDHEDYIYIFLCETAATAKYCKKLYNNLFDENNKYIKARLDYQEHLLKKYGDDMTDEERNEIRSSIKSSEQRLENSKKQSVGSSGKVFWYGTKDAVKATK